MTFLVVAASACLLIDPESRVIAEAGNDEFEGYVYRTDGDRWDLTRDPDAAEQFDDPHIVPEIEEYFKDDGEDLRFTIKPIP